MILALLLSTGCYSQAEFADDQATATCDWYDRCELLAVLTYDDVDTCVTANGPTDTGYTCPAFDASEGQDCVAALESAGCDDLALPAACEAACAAPQVQDTGATD